MNIRTCTLALAAASLSLAGCFAVKDAEPKVEEELP